jgi:hypothetical protein
MTRIPRPCIAALICGAVTALSAQTSPPARSSVTSAARAPSRDPVDEAVRRLNWRSVGPANNAGRISDIVGIPGDPSTYYVAAANGGIIKTTNAGTTFKPIFDRQTSSSIGAIARHGRRQPAQQRVNR